ncbi:hypothetical protein BOSEA31B_13547 [Hyphomicrobiales bacterium]|nr:hypothetical protein BOSEA31B_13547 [Hyphomicrobiales bacterium]CAH1699318.1 hypothetical protein BOSEA1005_12371 [Hyphomicrobiales bacterium]CAI0343105.1 hypothetical protein BO1005MUT1_210170 [Hyphomicrobiales bacterium]
MDQAKKNRPGGRFIFLFAGAAALPHPGQSASGVGLDLEHLTAAIHAALQVDMVRAAQLAGVLVFDIGGLLQRVGRAAHATLRRRRLSLRNGHCTLHRAAV